jgi:hypothetical protein
MRRLRCLVAAVCATLMLVAAMVGTTLAQSPSVPPSGAPATAPATAAASPGSSVAVGPITWKAVTKGKDFTNVPQVYAVGQLPDGRLVVVGSAAGSGAAWVSADGSKWARLKLKTPKGSAISAIGTVGSTVVMTGIASDGSGLAWTSADGTKWTDAKPMSGTVYTLASTPTGVVGVGVGGGAAVALSSADGVTWQSVSLAPSGRAVHVVAGPDGTLVAAGVVGDAAGVGTPVTWSSVDGTTWTQHSLEGLLPGSWSVPAAASTPVGFLVSLVERGNDGIIGHTWVSPDGVTWAATPVDPVATVSTAGSVGNDAMLIGGGQVLRSADAVTWTATDEPSFHGWTVRDVMKLADGRLFAAGDAGGAFSPSGSAMATWTGTVSPAP